LRALRARIDVGVLTILTIELEDAEPGLGMQRPGPTASTQSNGMMNQILGAVAQNGSLNPAVANAVSAIGANPAAAMSQLRNAVPGLGNVLSAAMPEAPGGPGQAPGGPSQAPGGPGQAPGGPGKAGFLAKLAQGMPGTGPKTSLKSLAASAAGALADRFSGKSQSPQPGRPQSQNKPQGPKEGIALRKPEDSVSVVLVLIIFLMGWTKAYYNVMQITVKEVKDGDWAYTQLITLTLRMLVPYLEVWVVLLCGILILFIVDKVLATIMSLSANSGLVIADGYAVNIFLSALKQWPILGAMVMSMIATVGASAAWMYFIRIQKKPSEELLRRGLSGIHIFGLILGLNMMITQGFVLETV
jgi:hypothetical protein